MVTSNKDAAKIWAEIEKARNVTPKDERGANDLERRIDDLMAINKKHQQQNQMRKRFCPSWTEASLGDSCLV